METIHPDWKEFLHILNSNHVKYLIVGAYALALHGHPRFTSDLGCFFEVSQDNIANLVAALERFGFSGVEREKLTIVPQVIMLGKMPFRIDLLNSISGVEFNDAWQARCPASLGGEPVNIISIEHFAINKRASGRAKDLADLEELGLLE